MSTLSEGVVVLDLLSLGDLYRCNGSYTLYTIVTGLSSTSQNRRSCLEAGRCFSARQRGSSFLAALSTSRSMVSDVQERLRNRCQAGIARHANGLSVLPAEPLHR